jgi:hypothetical protein
LKDVSDITFCVSDRGVFFPIAERLAREAKRVIYHRPNAESFETLAELCKGSGHDNVEFTTDFWPLKKEIDVFVFPDCKDGGDQLELESQGYPVWGSKSTGTIEEMRGQWIDVCKQSGLPFPKTEVVHGLTNLHLYLKDHIHEKPFVKISRIRGDMETWQAKTIQFVQNKIDYYTAKWGPLKERLKFYVQQPVETKIESGADSYNIWGEYPDEVILGYERKAESYLAVVKKRSEMPEQVWACAEAIKWLLKERRYANFISSEVRVPDDDEGRWLDPCFRTPSPAGEEQLEMLINFPKIVAAGAHGELVQPEWAGEFCGEAVISSTSDRESWKSIVVPKEIQQWVKLYACAYEDGAYHFPPSQDPDAIGCAVAIGDTPIEVIELLKELQEALKDQPVDLHIEPMADLIAEIEEAEKQGIPFTEKEMPEPADVLESS